MPEMRKHEGRKDHLRLQLSHGCGPTDHPQRRPVGMLFKIRLFVSMTGHRPVRPAIINTSFSQRLFAFFLPGFKLIDGFIVLEQAIFFSGQFFKIGIVGS